MSFFLGWISLIWSGRSIRFFFDLVRRRFFFYLFIVMSGVFGIYMFGISRS